MATKVQYKIVPVDFDGSVSDMEAFLNDFGATGWELAHYRERKGFDKASKKKLEDLVVFQRKVQVDDKEKKQ